MVRNDLYITVPNLFRCPISLDVMKSPVSLCTGVTYDRSSIQRWLDSGNNTCPATMQVLPTKDLVPNHTLQRLIQIWSDSVRTRSDSPPVPTSLTQDQARDLIDRIKTNHKDNNESCIAKLTSFAIDSDENRKFLATIDGILTLLLKFLVDQSKNIYMSEKIIQLCGMILDECSRDREQIAKLVMEKDFMTSMLLLLQRGCIDSKIATARVLELLSANFEWKIFIAERTDVLSELLRLVNSESDPNAIEVGLSCLISISMPKRARATIIRLGSVKTLGKMLSDSDLSVSIVEKVLKLLEMVSSCREGRSAICEDGVCVQAIVKKVLKVSTAATEHAVTVLWSLCCLFRDQKAAEAVRESNGLAKILLLMQSNCSPAVRQMSGDLLKIFRVNSKSCLSSYDTKTTHIMPF